MGFRTDLAIENREMYHEENGGKDIEIPGVKVDVSNRENGITVTKIEIMDDQGSQIMGKAIGSYITIETENALDCEEYQQEEISAAIADELAKLVKFHYKLKVLVIGLGNKSITPDSLGPLTAEKVKVTRHMFLITNADGDDDVGCVSVLTPGVMATTGMETAELIEKAVEITKPEVIIAIDALAARNLERISTTVQISDTGISPGAGTGNMRKVLTEQTVGTKVVAIGVPTVIDSRTLVLDSLSDFLKDPEGARNYMEENNVPMIVTSSEIDAIVSTFSEIIAKAVNITLHPGIYS